MSSSYFFEIMDFFRFCMDLDDFCSPYLLANFFISSFLICVVGFQLFTVRNTSYSRGIIISITISLPG